MAGSVTRDSFDVIHGVNANLFDSRATQCTPFPCFSNRCGSSDLWAVSRVGAKHLFKVRRACSFPNFLHIQVRGAPLQTFDDLHVRLEPRNQLWCWYPSPSFHGVGRVCRVGTMEIVLCSRSKVEYLYFQKADDDMGTKLSTPRHGFPNLFRIVFVHNDSCATTPWAHNNPVEHPNPKRPTVVRCTWHDVRTDAQMKEFGMPLQCTSRLGSTTYRCPSGCALCPAINPTYSIPNEGKTILCFVFRCRASEDLIRQQNTKRKRAPCPFY